MDKEKINKIRKEGWIEVWFAIEAMGTSKDVTESAMAKHIEKLSKTKDIFVYEKIFRETEKVKNPPKGVKEAFSQVVEVKLFAKDLFTLINIVMVYGPSAIEILGPNKKEIKIDEIQNIANVLAGVIHQFASAGVGGIVISPK
jgi:hypothetical protein